VRGKREMTAAAIDFLRQGRELWFGQRLRKHGHAGCRESRHEKRHDGGQMAHGDSTASR
jgi:hypothetical protein